MTAPQSPLSNPPRERSHPWLWMTIAFTMAGVAFGSIAWRQRPQPYHPGAVPRAITPRGDLAQDESATIELFRAVSPSVVYVTTQSSRDDAYRLSRPDAVGTGSGFVWNRLGHIVTNQHVIAGAEGLWVRLADQSEYLARVIGVEPQLDLAVLFIDADAERLVPIPLGVSADLAVGQTAFAIGNPFGFDHTLTTGVVSGLDRELEGQYGALLGLIQTNAAIHPGNSGGPLLDSAGRLIGVNTAIVTPSGVSAGLGFAIPVDPINQVVTQIIRGEQDRPTLGVYLKTVVDNDRQREWLMVTGVLEGSGADEAGLRSGIVSGERITRLGDLILGIADVEVGTVQELLVTLGRYQAGDTVDLQIYRDGGRIRIPVTLQPARRRGGRLRTEDTGRG